MFDILEQRHAEDFGKVRVGRNLYDALHLAVRDAEVPGATEDFENRFLPLLDPARSPRKVELGPAEMADQDRIAAADGRASGWGWIGALCAVGVVVGALVLGLTVLSTIVAKSPARTKRHISDAQVTKSALETLIGAEPAQKIRADQEPSAEYRGSVTGTPNGD
jgi:hypothetical protein